MNHFANHCLAYSNSEKTVDRLLNMGGEYLERNELTTGSQHGSTRWGKRGAEDGRKKDNIKKNYESLRNEPKRLQDVFSENQVVSSTPIHGVWVGCSLCLS